MNPTKKDGRSTREPESYVVQHGHARRKARTSEYRSWYAMIQRCTNPRNERWKNYGGRGIKVCERWHEFSNFLADMGSKPTPKHQIGRKDNDGDYCRDNCQWETQVQQVNNTSRNVYLTMNGVTKSRSDWARDSGVNYSTFRDRIARGLDLSQALIP